MAVYSKNIGVPPRRLSTAVQFFEEDEFNEEFIKMSTSEKVRFIHRLRGMESKFDSEKHN